MKKKELDRNVRNWIDDYNSIHVSQIKIPKQHFCTDESGEEFLMLKVENRQQFTIGDFEVMESHFRLRFFGVRIISGYLHLLFFNGWGNPIFDNSNKYKLLNLD